MENKTLIDYLKDINEKVQILSERNEIKKSDSHLFAFRGESRDYGETKLMPSLFRDESYVAKEKYLFELLADYGVIGEEKKRNIEKVIEAQHYVEISRMLDVTFNVLAALYFACSSERNMDKDAFIYIFCFPEHYSPHSAYIEDFYKEVLNKKSRMYSKNFKVVSHSYANDRIKAQSGGFIFFQGKEFSPINDIYYETVKIKSVDKEKILKDLSLLFAVNEASIYPEKEKKAQLAKQKFMHSNYVERELSFQEEIYTYFERVQYECSMIKKRDKAQLDKMAYLRRLRKEKADLLTYIYENVMFNYFEDDVSKEKVIKKWNKYVEDNFKILERV